MYIIVMKKQVCSKCNGNKRIKDIRVISCHYDVEEIIVDCPQCNGTGVVGDIRIIQRRKSDMEWECVRMVDIKKGDEFKIFEPDMTYVGLFFASSDGYLNKDGVGAVECECSQSESK